MRLNVWTVATRCMQLVLREGVKWENNACQVVQTLLKQCRGWTYFLLLRKFVYGCQFCQLWKQGCAWFRNLWFQFWFQARNFWFRFRFRFQGFLKFLIPIPITIPVLFEISDSDSDSDSSQKWNDSGIDSDSGIGIVHHCCQLILQLLQLGILHLHSKLAIGYHSLLYIKF